MFSFDLYQMYGDSHDLALPRYPGNGASYPPIKVTNFVPQQHRTPPRAISVERSDKARASSVGDVYARRSELPNLFYEERTTVVDEER